MTTVWVIMGYDTVNEYGWVEAVAVSEEKAKEILGKINPNYRIDFDISECRVEGS